MNILKKVNIIPIIFLLNIVSLFIGNYSINYAFILLISLYLIGYIYKVPIYIKNINRNLIFIILISIFYMIIITLLSVFNEGNIYNVIKLTLLLIPFVLGITITMIFGKDYIKNGLIHISNIMTLINIYGIIEFINKENFLVSFINDESVKSIVNGFIHTKSYRSSALFTNSIVYGSILVIIFWINIYLIQNKKLRYFNSMLILINIYATRSRSSWIAIIVTFFIYLSFNIIKSRKIKFSYKNILFGFLGMFITVVIFNTNTFNHIINEIVGRFMELNTSSGAISATQRLGTISKVLWQMYNQPIIIAFLGNGFGSVHNLMKNITVDIVGFITTDNQYLSILWEFGIIGSIMMLYYTMAIIVENFNLKNKVNDCIMFSIISISILMFFYEVYYWPIISQILFIGMGVICINDRCIDIYSNQKYNN